MILARRLLICAPAADFEKHSTAWQGVPFIVSIHVPGRLPSSQMDSSSCPRNATLPSSPRIMDVPSERPRMCPRLTCAIACSCSTLAAIRSEPSRPFQLASTVPTRSPLSCSHKSGFPARLVHAISALVKSARLARTPLRGGGGCATPRIESEGAMRL